MSNVRASDTRVSNLLVFSFLLVCLLPFELAWDLLARLFRLVLANENFSGEPYSSSCVF